MDKNRIITEIRALLGDSDQEAALKLLMPFLASESKYKQLNNYAIAIKANLEKTKKDENFGILSTEKSTLAYNKVNYDIIDLLDRLDRNELSWKPPGVNPSKVVTISLSSIVVLVVAGFFIFKWLSPTPAPSTPAVAVDDNPCPDFEKDGMNAFNILLFPFQAFGSEVSNSHKAISLRLGDLAQKYNIKLGVDFYNKGNISQSDFPVNISDAEQKATPCKANLVIWGTEEAVAAQTIVRTRYKFLNIADDFSFHEIQLAENTEIDTITSFSSIANGEELLTENIETTIMLLFGIMAREKSMDDVAQDVLESIDYNESSDSTHVLIGEMMLADIYLDQGEKQKAYDAYSNVLEVHEDYWLARKNRGFLNLAKSNYQDAIDDLSVELEKRPDDTSSLIARGIAYTKTEQLGVAKKDLEKASKIAPKNRAVLKANDDLVQKERVLRAQQEAKKKEVVQNPNNINALNDYAKISQSVGDYQKALEATEQVLEKDPNNSKAFSTQAKVFLEIGDQQRIQQLLEKAQDKGVTRDNIIQTDPAVLRKIMVQPKVLKKN